MLTPCISSSQFPHLEMIQPPAMVPHILGFTNVLGDGNCGFRAAAVSMGRSSEEWIQVCQEMISELDANPIFKNAKVLENIWGKSFEMARKTLNHKSGSAPLPFWMTFPAHGFLLAQTYKRPVILFSKAWPSTFLPLTSLPPNSNTPNPICLFLLDDLAHMVTFKY